jgi:hypothetical protein
MATGDEEATGAELSELAFKERIGVEDVRSRRAAAEMGSHGPGEGTGERAISGVVARPGWVIRELRP